MRPCPYPETVAEEPIGAQATGTQGQAGAGAVADHFQESEHVSILTWKLAIDRWPCTTNERIFGEMGGRHRPRADAAASCLRPALWRSRALWREETWARSHWQRVTPAPTNSLCAEIARSGPIVLVFSRRQPCSCQARLSCV
jgi:hypothetical protein